MIIIYKPLTIYYPRCLVAMGYGRYLAFRAVNSLIVLLVALLIASLAFNALAEKTIEAIINDRVNQIRQQLAQRHVEFIDVLKGVKPRLLEWNITAKYKDKVWNCYVFLEDYEAGKLTNMSEDDINGVAEQCYLSYIKTREEISWGLNLPGYVRIILYVWKSLTLDFGEARMKYPQFGTNEIRDMVLIAMGRTALLFTTAYMINVAIALLLGLQMARKVGSPLDRGVSVIAMISASLPMFWVAMLLIYVFTYQLHIYPGVAMEPMPASIRGNILEELKWWLWHLYVPILTIVLVGFGGGAYATRNLVISIMQEDFVTTARAKGVPERKVIYGHVLRAASPPIVTSISLGFIGTFFGAIISEVVFQWPGMGSLYYLALSNADVPVLMANTFMFVFLFVLVRFLLEIIYGVLDPRIRASR